jgi:hypothetical protein
MYTHLFVNIQRGFETKTRKRKRERERNKSLWIITLAAIATKKTMVDC